MKLATRKLNTPAYPPSSPPPSPPDAHQGSGQGLFFGVMVRSAGITRKDLVDVMRWSKTYIDGIMNGTKNDPLVQTRKFCAELYRRKRGDLVPAVLVYIAGEDDFDGRVLTPLQVEAIKELAKVVKP